MTNLVGYIVVDGFADDMSWKTPAKGFIGSYYCLGLELILSTSMLCYMHLCRLVGC